MIYEKFEGNSVSAHIENTDAKAPYTIIGAKAFLSCKNVYEIELPSSICEIRDWAFAHMKELKRIVIPSNRISLGKNVFLDCDNLQEICVFPDESNNDGLPYLLASCITILKSYELLDFEMAATRNKQWCENYDAELEKYICQADDKNFQPVIVGWFNDEGEEEQLERYIEKVKEDKIKLCFLRLKFDAYISDDTKEILLSYLRKCTENPNDSSWKIIKDVLSGDIQYAKLAVMNGLLSGDSILELIRYLNNKNASTEIVAYLVQSISDNNKSIDEQFEL